MRRKHELVGGHKISVWDFGGTGDRWAVIDLESGDSCNSGNVMYLAMSGHPSNPQGIGQTGEMPLSAVQYMGRGGSFTRRIRFADLPADCQ